MPCAGAGDYGGLADTEVEARFVTVEKSQVGSGGQAGEGSGDAFGGIGGVVFLDTGGEEAGLDEPGSAEAPVGGGHFLDHSELHAVGGGQAVQMLGQ
jgi:hypothetical protein